MPWGSPGAAEAAGVRIFEQTRAIVDRPWPGVRKRISTQNARVRAAHVVLAGNVGADRLLPATAGTLVPITTYVIVTAPLGVRLAEAIATKASVSDTNLANNHYRIVDGDRLMWSGRSTLWPGEPRRYIAALQTDIARAYPQLGPSRSDFAWNGTLGNTTHRMPQIGEAMPGVWLLERLRRAWAQHDRHGRGTDRAGDPGRRRHVAAVRAVSSGLGRWSPRPRRRPGLHLVV